MDMHMDMDMDMDVHVHVHVHMDMHMQQLVAHGDGAEDLRRGEGRVQEEADARRAQLAQDVRGQQQQVVVVDPDEVARVGRLVRARRAGAAEAFGVAGLVA